MPMDSKKLASALKQIKKIAEEWSPETMEEKTPDKYFEEIAYIASEALKGAK